MGVIGSGMAIYCFGRPWGCVSQVLAGYAFRVFYAVGRWGGEIRCWAIVFCLGVRYTGSIVDCGGIGQWLNLRRGIVTTLPAERG